MRLIDADSLINTLKTSTVRNDESPKYAEGATDGLNLFAVKIVENAPTIYAEVEQRYWPSQSLFDDGFGGGRAGYICPWCKQYVPYAGKYCGKCGKRVYGGDE